MGPCERCKKAQATFHLTNIEPSGKKLERHLCESCAAEEGWLQVQKPPVDIEEYLENFVASGKSGAAVSGLICENCGMSYVEFRNQGLLGCANDYDIFREPLTKLLQRVHDGATHHTGKTPGAADGAAGRGDRELRRLRRLLDEAVLGEDYERAAKLRDEIRSLENS